VKENSVKGDTLMARQELMAAAVLLGAATLCASAAELGVGDAAPKLAVKEFIKGKAITQFEEGKIYVVEFWATWCIPCRQSIPHLTELQKKYKEVTFIGVSVAEREPRKVKPFVEEMGDTMDYRVAIDLVAEGKKAAEGAMVQTWMVPANKNAIPTAFIVDEKGKIAWVGKPREMGEPLEKIHGAAKAEQESARRLIAKLPEVERAAVKTIQKLGGKVARGEENIITVNLTGAQVTDETLKELKGLKGLQQLKLTDTQVTDAGLKELKGLEELQILFLNKTQVTDAGLKELKGLKKLQRLGLTRTKVTDAGLKELKELKKLRFLFLSKTRVTEAGMDDLEKALPKLKIVR
jgi:thiol-disulfide isomerase/thioredoxin